VVGNVPGVEVPLRHFMPAKSSQQPRDSAAAIAIAIAITHRSDLEGQGKSISCLSCQDMGTNYPG
jgi:Holliday junction resolvasome RuvABC endonuclease subunit